jgi:hypothetical protein
MRDEASAVVPAAARPIPMPPIAAPVPVAMSAVVDANPRNAGPHDHHGSVRTAYALRAAMEADAASLTCVGWHDCNGARRSNGSQSH